MNISISQAFNCKNILALKDFSTYLFTYRIHEMPRGKRKGWLGRFIERCVAGFIFKCLRESTRQRLLLKVANDLVRDAAMKEFIELRGTELEKLTVKLKDCKTELYSVLHVAADRKSQFDSAQDMFRAISETILEFDKIRTPVEETQYVPAPADPVSEPVK